MKNISLIWTLTLNKTKVTSKNEELQSKVIQVNLSNLNLLSKWKFTNKPNELSVKKLRMKINVIKIWKTLKVLK